jgi:hypothetical protein
MKTSLFFSVVAFFCLGPGLAAELYGKVIPESADVALVSQSAANAEGAVVELLYRRDVNAEVLALRQSSGERRYLYHRNPVGLYPAVPEITKSIHWLTPDSFACVASGRLKSYYTLYRLKPMEDAPGTMHAWKEAEGCCHFRLEWQVQDGQLIGCWQGKPYVTISPLSLLFDDSK